MAKSKAGRKGGAKGDSKPMASIHDNDMLLARIAELETTLAATEAVLADTEPAVLDKLIGTYSEQENAEAAETPAVKTAGRKHSVRCTIEVPELTKSGSAVRFDVHADGEKIGTILLGRGSITWYGGKRKTGVQISWTKFAELMNQHCNNG